MPESRGRLVLEDAREVSCEPFFHIAASRPRVDARKDALLCISFERGLQNVALQIRNFACAFYNRDVGDVPLVGAQGGAFALVFENRFQPAFRQQRDDEGR